MNARTMDSLSRANRCFLCKRVVIHRGKNRVPDLGFYPIDLGICSSNVFKVPKTTMNTFDGTDPKVDRIKPKVRNTIFFPCGCSHSFPRDVV